MGRRPKRRGRDIHGMLLLDKPSGISSNRILQKVKSLFNANKAGHTGALDPLATGMLPICLGEATKFSRYLLDADKRYHVVARLGERTDTADADGEIIQRRPVQSNQQQIEQALAQFRGKFEQSPPIYSALKFQGKPLYSYARQGIAVPQKRRMIEVYQLALLRVAPDELELEIHCSKGTYIRTIIDDLGEVLGCGAHVIKLRRVQVSGYSVADMVTFDQLQGISDERAVEQSSSVARLDALLLPFDSAVSHYAAINLPVALACKFKQGAVVHYAAAECRGLIRVTQGQEHAFLGMANIDEAGFITPERLVAETFISL